MRKFLDIEYKKGLMLDALLPDSKEFSLFVFFHGGGLVAGDRKNTDVFAKTLCENGIGVVSVDYSMYPNAKFPDFITDCAESIAWVKNNMVKFGCVNEIYVGGSSAGGYISMMLCFDKKYLNAVGVNSSEIAGYIHDAGQPTTHFNVLSNSGVDGRRLIVDERSPLFFVGCEKEYPPMIFIVSDNDMQNRYEQTILTISTLKHFGFEKNVFLKVMPSSTHTSYTYKQDEKGDGVFAKIILEFISNIEK